LAGALKYFFQNTKIQTCMDVKRDWAVYLMVLMAALLFVYSAIRSDRMSMTHDESGTYLHYHNVSLWECLASAKHWDSANNHLLNTFLMQQSVGIFGVKEWSIRLPNLLAHLLYLVSSIFILLAVSRKWYLMLAGFALLNFNPYLLDFFSLARGYGLSIAFCLAAVWQMVRYAKSGVTASVVGAFALAALAVLSNFTAFNFFASLWAGFVVVRWMQDDKNWKRTLGLQAIPAGFAMLLYFLLRIPLKALQQKGEFDWGVERLAETFSTLVSDSLYGATYLSTITEDVFLVIAVMATAACITFAALQYLRHQWQHFTKVFWLTIALLLATIVVLLAQRFSLDSKYFVGRKSLIFIPLASMVLYCGMVWLHERLPVFTRWAAIGLFLFSTFHLLRTGSLDTYREWWYDRYTHDMLAYLQTVSPAEGHIRLGVHWMFQPSSEYYRQLEPYRFFDPLVYSKTIQKDTTYDYYYLFKSDYDPDLQARYTVEKEYGGFSYLLRRK
jgi:hypothetical protein